MEQDIQDLAAALEALAAALLVMDRDPKRAASLIRVAQSMAAAIRQEASADDALTEELRCVCGAPASEHGSDFDACPDGGYDGGDKVKGNA